MNFLDPLDITRSTTPNPNQPEQPSLNEEVNQVIGQLGRFWGGFRKQSQTVFEHAKKDFGDVVVQAQKELTKLTTTDTPATTIDENTNKEEGTSTGAGTTEASTSSGEASTSASAARETPSSSTSSATLFSRIQAALPPNIVQTVQNNIPESLKHASESIDIQQMRANILSELQRVQGVTLAQAEEYAHKSETLLREAMKEAGEVLREAVKVIPPDQVNGNGSNVLWDGADMWMLPEPNLVGKEKEGSNTKSLETQSAVISRAEALLRRLKQDPTIIRHDPEAEEGVKEQYNLWKEKEVDTLDGGVEGAEWKSKIETALQDSNDNQSLKQLQETLVPSEMNQTTFWLRFFFRTHQIRSEEEKRKALLQRTIENEDDFSWEDEEDEASSPTTSKHTQPSQSPSNTVAAKKPMTDGLTPPSTSLDTAGTPSPRVSSEGSFDLVSSANISVVDDVKPSMRKETDDDGDSDWE
ncbi:hypothetical protein JR316_0001910 [Psilocybe cubensis]|uniref:Uncharacterized protein n=2 Tax=Psilocybe cubensis TaxID=181762 RepID=A0ACB8HBZ7_PSICU|nr:hypothetical protein JR316_0001910 [Psilocybe cubensis]KAH9485006.1 hypothetical protein JR316_0001910 [Psilocybe cubensis]